MERLAGKVAIVTGSTRGIGEAIARRFARCGAGVVVSGRDAARGEKVAAGIEADGGEAIFVRADVSRAADASGLVEAAVARFGRLTTLVNNAAATDRVGPGRGDAALAEVEDDAWRAILDTGLEALRLTCRAAVPAMRAAGGGAIVNVSAHAAARGVPGMAAYSASKAAMEALTRSLAVDGAADGIRCNAIRSGFVHSGPWIDEQMDARALERLRARLLTRVPVPDDIAHAAVFLASDEAEVITGTVMVVDAGTGAR